MNIKRMSVQYVGSTLMLPAVNARDKDKPFGLSRLERDVSQIIARTVDGKTVTFVPETKHDMTLDEAIVKAKNAGDWQLVEWLRTARGSEYASRWYTKKLHGLGEENDRMRKLIADMYYRLDQSILCHLCPDKEECEYDCLEGCTMRDDFKDEIRELGIKVEQ